MSQSPSTLLQIVQRLLAHQVPLVVIGGHAVNMHGFARATEDVDVVFRRTVQSEQHLLGALVELNAYWIGSDIDPSTGIERIHPVTAEFLREKHLMMLGTDLGFLDLFDFIPAMPAESLDDLFETSIQREGIPFASLAWIRRMKEAADRPQDRIDLANLPEPS